MKISKMEIVPISLPVRKWFTSFGRWHSEFVLVKIETDSGDLGIGGGNPFPSSYCESQGTMMSAIHDLLAPAIIGENPFDTQKITNKMDAVLGKNYLAKASVDFALYDLIGRIRGEPVYNLIGGLARDRIQLGEMIGISGPEEAREEALKLKEAGFAHIKIKVGGISKKDMQRDLATVEAVREALGDKMELRIDANQNWTREKAKRMIKEMQKYDIAVAEQPLPWWDITGHAYLCKLFDTPIMVDESAFSIQELINVIKGEAADMLELHLPKPGGIFRSIQYVSIAEAAGLPVSLGLMRGGWIETAINSHFCAALEWMGRTTHHCGVVTSMTGKYNSRDIEPDVVKGDLPRIENGYLYPPNSPGFGYELNEEFIEKYMTEGKKPLVIEAK